MKYIIAILIIAINILVLIHLVRIVDDYTLSSQQSYLDGFEAGKAAIMQSIPETCTAWWFKEDPKNRHKQIRAAFCKGGNV